MLQLRNWIIGNEFCLLARLTHDRCTFLHAREVLSAAGASQRRAYTEEWIGIISRLSFLLQVLLEIGGLCCPHRMSLLLRLLFSMYVCLVVAVKCHGGLEI